MNLSVLSRSVFSKYFHHSSTDLSLTLGSSFLYRRLLCTRMVARATPTTCLSWPITSCDRYLLYPTNVSWGRESFQQHAEDNKLGESKSVSSYNRAFRVFKELAKEQAITRCILDEGRQCHNGWGRWVDDKPSRERDYRVSGFKSVRRVDSKSTGQLIVRICESNHNHRLRFTINPNRDMIQIQKIIYSPVIICVFSQKSATSFVMVVHFTLIGRVLEQTGSSRQKTLQCQYFDGSRACL